MRHPCHFFREWQLIRWRRDALGEPRGPSGLPAAGTGFRGEVILVNGPPTADSTRVDAANANLTVDAE
jgi:hypothetical protein